MQDRGSTPLGSTNILGRSGDPGGLISLLERDSTSRPSTMRYLQLMQCLFDNPKWIFENYYVTEDHKFCTLIDYHPLFSKTSAMHNLKIIVMLEIKYKNNF